MLHDLTYRNYPGLTGSNNSRYSYNRLIVKDKLDDHDISQFDYDAPEIIYQESSNNHIMNDDNYIYHLVSLSETNRLDIISNIHYNTPKYWWLIAEYNHLINPRIINPNTYLKIPPLTELYNRGGALHNGFKT